MSEKRRDSLEKTRHVAAEQLALYVRICETAESIPKASWQQIADAIRRPVSVVWQTISRLEEFYQVKLLNHRSERKGDRITIDGQSLRRLAQDVLCKQREVYAWRPQGINDLSFATTPSILISLLSQPIAEFLGKAKWRRSCNLKLREFANSSLMIQELKAGRIDIALAPYSSRMCDDDITVTPFQPEFPMLLVGHPTHALMCRRSKSVKLSELSSVILFSPPREFQPGILEALPLPNLDEGGAQIEVDSFPAMIAHTAWNIGLGLAPGWTAWILDYFRSAGLLAYRPLSELGRIRIAAYWLTREPPKSGTAADLLKLVRTHINAASPGSPGQPNKRK